jgi:hypothetical protein
LYSGAPQLFTYARAVEAEAPEKPLPKTRAINVRKEINLELLFISKL